MHRPVTYYGACRCVATGRSQTMAPVGVQGTGRSRIMVPVGVRGTGRSRIMEPVGV